MSKKVPSRRELLSRWGKIEEEEQENEDSDPSTLRRLNQRKEEWFADAFNILISLPKDAHIWCGNGDIMGPLLETFYSYFKEERNDAALKLLWKRISDEMRICVQCVFQHHQTQEMYEKEYEYSSVGPLLAVLQKLDEDRVTRLLQGINSKLVKAMYDPQYDYAEVVSVMYEVLMFPILLDDQSLCTEFEKFIESIDNIHELALAGNQEFPGVYALLFLNRRVRIIGYRLAKAMGKLRSASDLERFQPLLKKFIGTLEMDGLPTVSQEPSLRVNPDRASIWLGITSLLEFLEAPAFEEGILEPYPIFIDTVLNHISGDSPEFSQAVSCLKELFKMLGCKLWLRSTLSPSVMRNTLLGQCFHTRSEKIHKAIFDLFQPLLQSLEALQDGEHGKQRRHFLYFLLHQVPVSSNFSVLARRIAHKIALLIVLRGYQMNPPCPPFECAHMWGPSLVSSFRDSSLHISLRQPAFDLAQAILVSDTTALLSSVLRNSIGNFMYAEGNYDEDNVNLPLFQNAKEDNNCPWSEFTEQSKITVGECREWMCVPMLWVDTLADTSPLNIPASFSKAVFWARSRFFLVEYEKNAEMAVDIKTWLSSSAVEITPMLGWKVPTGSDDGGPGKESKNSVRVSAMCRTLIRTLKRLTTYFLVQMGQLREHWTWEPRMAESLILSLSDPDDHMRQFGKCMLEQVSNTRGLACGLKFLCSESSYFSSIFSGVRHALKQVQLDCVLQNFQILHHFLFLLFKLLKEEDVTNKDRVENMSAGGFLRQPSFDALAVSERGSSINISPELLEQFCYALSEVAWGPIKKCLVEGKAFIHQSLCQMTCVRLLEILPVLLGRLKLIHEGSWSTNRKLKGVTDFKWLPDLIHWGSSQLKVVVVYWRRALGALQDILKGSKSDACTSVVRAIESLLSSDDTDMDRLAEQVSRVRVSLSEEVLCNISTASVPGEENQAATHLPHLSLKGNEHKTLNSVDGVGKATNSVIDLSDDETEKEVLRNLPTFYKFHQPDVKARLSSGKKVSTGVDASQSSFAVPHKRNVTGSSSVSTKDLGISRAKPPGPNESEEVGGMSRKAKARQDVRNSAPSESKANLKRATDEPITSGASNQAQNDAIPNTKSTVLKKLVHATEDDPLESALKSVKTQPLSLSKPGPVVPKRQVIQLNSPVNKKFNHLQRPGAGFKRFKPPKLEDWFRRILQLDYFATVGLASTNKDENQNAGKFKEVPVRFDSPEQYVQIFQPLVLEEFKAQLQSSFQELSSLDEVYFGILSVLSVERVDDFHFVRFVHEDADASSSKSFSENDLVLFTKEHPTSSNLDVNMMGKVDGREWDDKRRSSIILIRIFLLNASLRLNQARRNLLERSKWHASRILNITSQIREFQALSSIKDIPILPIILNPVSDIHHSEAKKSDLPKLPHSLQQILKSSFNESQLQAISISIDSTTLMKDFDLSLIQGPPGTGKTRTIVAIISALLASLSHRTGDGGNAEQDHRFSTASRQRPSQSVAMARAWQDAALAKQLNGDVETSKQTVENSSKGRVLICAQSNAAVDELVSRISSSGLYGRDGKMYKPYIVRVGNAKTVHPNSMPFFLDTLVDQRLAEERMRLNKNKSNKAADSSAVLRSNLEKVVDRIAFFEAKRANLNQGSADIKDKLEDENHNGDDEKPMSDIEIGARLRRLYEQKRQIYKDLSAVQAQERKANAEIKALRHKLRKSILKEAQIVVTTLSGCGGDLYTVCSESISAHKFGSPPEHTLFDAVVIDEAAQALEPATLIPLQLLKSRGTKCIMVGDPKQLTATVFSNVASKFSYECSMFERLQRAGYPVLMLTQQYRMHPEICQFPSMHFYDNKLLNGERMSSKSAPFHRTHYLGPYVFYDIVDGQERRSGDSGSMSLCNEHEADAAVQLLKFFKKRYPFEFVPGRIGIITPYKRQLSVLRSRFSSAFGPQVVADMELNTVDGFQGREVDILVLSTVRASGSGSTSHGINPSGIGFVADIRRMNVALTRARLALWILGNTRTLQRDHNWAALVRDAKERNVVMSIEKPYNSMFGQGNLDPKHSEHPLESFQMGDDAHHPNPTESAASNRRMKNSDGYDVSLSSEGRDGKKKKRKEKDEPCFQMEKGAANKEKRLPGDGKSLIDGGHNRTEKGEEKEKGKGKEKRREKPKMKDTDADRFKNSDSNTWKESKKSSSELDRNKSDTGASKPVDEYLTKLQIEDVDTKTCKNSDSNAKKRSRKSSSELDRKRDNGASKPAVSSLMDMQTKDAHVNRCKNLDSNARKGSKKSSSEFDRKKRDSGALKRVDESLIDMQTEDADAIGCKGSEKSSLELDRNKRDAGASKTVDEVGQRDNRGNRGGAFHQGGDAENIISKRKQQREAVDAILFSSLLPSNKPKPTKRLLPPGSAASSEVRPSKAKKGSTSTHK